MFRKLSQPDPKSIHEPVKKITTVSHARTGLALIAAIIFALSGCGNSGAQQDPSDTDGQAATATQAEGATIEFEGGADGVDGETAPIKASPGETVELPENGYTRSGYIFAGWEENPEGDEPGSILQPGDTVTLGSSDLLFTARWDRGILAVDASLTAAGDTAEGIEEWSSEYKDAILRVKNDSDTPLVFASFAEFLDKKDESLWRTVTFTYWQLAPGESTLVMLGLDSVGAADVQKDANRLHWYIISKTDPNAGKQTFASPKQSLGDAVVLDESKVDDTSATVTVHDARSNQVEVSSVTLVGTTDDNVTFIATKQLEDSITADESADVTFTAGELFGDIEGVKLSDLTRTYYAEAGGKSETRAPLFWVDDDTVNTMWDALLYVPLQAEDFE